MIQQQRAVHPVAALFPMLDDDELADLAADIKERGLLQPIVLDQEGQILDGRNRFAACAIVGVDPEYVTYEGDDPGGYAMSVNINRRHLSKGQQAMLLAEIQNNSPRINMSAIARQNGLTQSRIAKACSVQQHAPELVGQVVAGNLSLDAAYQTAHDRKAADEALAQQIQRLKYHFADLEDKVTAEEMPLAEALAIATQREQQEQERAKVREEHVRRESTSFVRSVQWLAEGAPYELDGETVVTLFDQRKADINYQVTTASIDRAIQTLQEIRSEWEQNGR